MNDFQLITVVVVVFCLKYRFSQRKGSPKNGRKKIHIYHAGNKRE